MQRKKKDEICGTEDWSGAVLMNREAPNHTPVGANYSGLRVKIEGLFEKHRLEAATLAPAHKPSPSFARASLLNGD